MDSHNKRQIKVNKKDIKESLIETSTNDSFASYLFTKAKKISTASLLVTRHLDEENQLKKDIQESALSLIKEMSLNITDISKRTPFVFYSSDHSNEMYADVSRALITLHTYVVIGMDAYVLSEHNCRILLNVIDDLLAEIADKISSPTVLHENYFFVEKSVASEANEKISEKNLDKNTRTSEKKEINYLGHDKTYSKNNHSFNKVEVKDKISNDSGTSKTVVRKQDKKIPNKSQRQDQIISIIKDKGTVMIKDISSKINDCSEKTIQRELLKMVDAGILSKEGERRWSTYSLA